MVFVMRTTTVTVHYEGTGLSIYGAALTDNKRRQKKRWGQIVVEACCSNVYR